MVRGFEKNQERLQALSLLGKDLARRAHSHCELCGNSGVKLRTREIEPVTAEPVMEHCLLICEPCATEMDRRVPDTHYWRFLETVAWSELPALQVTAVRILRSIHAPWARDLLEQLYLFPEAEAWLEKSP